MNARRFVLLSLAALALASLAPAANACIQMYPWSELCEGDVQGFVEALLP